jgi:hypothetical protein
MIKNSLNNKLIIDYDDEDDDVIWYDEDNTCDNLIKITKKIKTNNNILKTGNTYIDCGCCDDCSCDSEECENCLCDCNINSLKDFDKSHDINITIIKNKKLGKKIGITLKLNFMLNDNINEDISIDFDINKSTYLKITNELL